MSVCAVFGGSFNPPHLAHTLVVATVLSTVDVDHVLVIPTYQHPFGKELAPYDDRIHMCELAMGWLPRVHVSRVEEELGGESRTLRTLEHLLDRDPTRELRLVIGADVLAEANKWYRFDRIREIAPPIVLGRQHFENTEVPYARIPAISSTQVRCLVAQEEWPELSSLVPLAVLAHIRERGLYRT